METKKEMKSITNNTKAGYIAQVALIIIICFALNIFSAQGQEKMVYDHISTGPSELNPSEYAVFNGKLYFAAKGPEGNELWMYDETNAPSLVADIRAGEYGSYPSELTVFNNKLYFIASDGSYNKEIWVYDGTNTPYMLADLNNTSNLPSFYHDARFTIFNNKLYFVAKGSDLYGEELWVYDGTNTPEMVIDLTDDMSDANIRDLCVLNNKLYFFAIEDVSYQYELWVYDGTNNPTMIDLNSGSASSSPTGMTVYNNKMYFSAIIDSDTGHELYEYDGSNLSLISDINPILGSSSYPKNFYVFDNKLFFAAQDTTSCNDCEELFVFDGSYVTKAPMKGQYSTKEIGALYTLNNKLYISANSYESYYNQFWVLDETDSIQRIESIIAGDHPHLSGAAIPFNNKFYYTAYNYDGKELWSFDGTNLPQIVYNLKNYGDDLVPLDFVEFDGNLYFSADDGMHGRELWVYDGENDPTMVFDIVDMGAFSSEPCNLTVFDNKLYFSAYDSLQNHNLWMYDGANTPIIVDTISTNSAGFYGKPWDFTVYNNKLYYRAANGIWEYSTNGSHVKLTDMTSFKEVMSVPEMIVYDNKLYFSGYSEGYNNNELHVYDGTNAPTMVADLNTTANAGGSSNPHNLAVVDGKLYFGAYNGSDNAAYEYNGTGTPTEIPITENDLRTPRNFFMYNGNVHFSMDRHSGGQVFLSYDGTNPATNLWEVSFGSTTAPLNFTIYNDDLYSIGYEVGDWYQIWKSNGPNAPVKVTNIAQGQGYGTPNNLNVFNGKLFFSCSDGTNGRELWVYEEIWESSCLTDDAVMDMHFPSNDVGYVVGRDESSQNPMIMKTIDGGLNWTKFTNIPDTIDRMLTSVYFISDSIGFIAGYEGVMLYTENGGVDWELKYVYDDNYGAIEFVNSDTGFAATIGQIPGHVVATYNGGADWNTAIDFNSQLNTNESFYASNMDVTNNSTIYIAGVLHVDGYASDVKIFKTNNSGNSWNAIDGPADFDPTHMSLQINFIDNMTGFISGTDTNDHYLLYKTTNGGGDWKKIETNSIYTSSNIHSIYFFDNTTGFIGSSSGVYKTVDGGITWESLYSHSATKLNFPSNQIGYAVGSDINCNYDLIKLETDYIVACEAAFDYNISETTGEPTQYIGHSFTDLSTGTIESWSWDLGDGASSNIKNPDHSYKSYVDTYITVSLSIATTEGCKSTFSNDSVFIPGISPWPIIQGGDENHTIIIPSNLTAFIEGDSLDLVDGDFIGFFFKDDNDSLQCSGLTQWTAENTTLSVWGSEGSEKNGFDSGERFSIKVWKTSTQQEYIIAESRYNTDTFTHTAYYSNNGLSKLEYISTIAVITPSQAIVLHKGWNLISSYIEPLSPAMSDIFSFIPNVIVKDAAGTIVYAPGYGINNGTWNSLQGYKAHVAQSDTLIINGAKIDPQTIIPLTKNSYPNFLPYYGSNEVALTTATASINSDINYIQSMEYRSGSKKVWAYNYIPTHVIDPAINQIGNMKPGLAYKTMMINEVNSFAYPSSVSNKGGKGNKGTKGSESNVADLQHFGIPITTSGENAILIIPEDFFNTDLIAGDEIGVFANGNVIAGALVYDGEHPAITVWENDSMYDGTSFDIRLWRKAENKEYALQLTYQDGTGLFGSNSMQIADGLDEEEILSIHDKTTNHSVMTYPNPAVSAINFKFKMQESGNVKLTIYNLSGQVAAVITNQSYPKGDHHIYYNVDNFSEGQYIYTLEYNDKLFRNKISIIK